VLIPISRNPDRSQLRIFSLCWFLFFGTFAVWSERRGITGTAVLIFATGCIAPIALLITARLAKWLYIAVSYAAWPIGFVLSFVVLMLLYFAVITPIGLVMRLVRYDPMKRNWELEQPTYWEPKPKAQGLRRYLRQF
jgi:hypothetical protein